MILKKFLAQGSRNNELGKLSAQLHGLMSLSHNLTVQDQDQEKAIELKLIGCA